MSRLERNPDFGYVQAPIECLDSNDCGYIGRELILVSEEVTEEEAAAMLADAIGETVEELMGAVDLLLEELPPPWEWEVVEE